MWREIRKLGEKKPVVASMGDVAASGGYYLSMGAAKVVAEPLTITGSIGVVTAKFNLMELYGKIGYSKTILSRGKYAQVSRQTAAAAVGAQRSHVSLQLLDMVVLMLMYMFMFMLMLY